MRPKIMSEPQHLVPPEIAAREPRPRPLLASASARASLSSCFWDFSGWFLPGGRPV